MTTSTPTGRRHPDDGSRLPLTTELRDGVLVVAGEIDLATVPTLAAALDPLIAAGGPIRIDTHGVTFMGSEGLHLLHDTAGQVTDTGRVTMLDPSRSVRRSIELSGLADDVDIVSPGHRVA